MTALAMLQGVNASAAFNVWAGFEVTAAGEGSAEIRLAWRPELGQYTGFLHAGLTGALIDTVCGFAGATVVGRVLASHYSVNFLSPAVGDAFVARGRVVRAGKRQVFTAAELFAVQDGREKLVATGETILMTVEA